VLIFFFSSACPVQDISILQTLRSLCPTLPIFFVHMSTSVDTMNLPEVDRNEVLNHGTLNFTSENERRNSGLEANKENAKSSSDILSQLSQLGKLCILKSDGKVFLLFSVSSKSKKKFFRRTDFCRIRLP